MSIGYKKKTKHARVQNGTPTHSFKQQQSDIRGTSIFGIKVNLRNNSNGDNPIAIIKSKFLFPSPNANAGEIDISMIKIFMTNCMYLFRFAFAARKKEINIFDSTPS